MSDGLIRNDITGIVDRGLYKAILLQIKSNGVQVKDNLLTEELVSNLKYLDISSTADLRGIEYCKNLNTLIITNVNLTDVTPLAALKNLECLSLGCNKIDDITPIKNMINLKQLYLPHNSIMDISPLKNLVNLESLSIRGNEIVDLTPLVYLVKLKSLSIEQNEIKDISVLSRLVNLTHLYFSDNDITDICALESIYNLQHLYMDYNDVSDISPLVGMMNLKSLALEGNFLTLKDVDQYLFQDFASDENWLEENGFDLDEYEEEDPDGNDDSEFDNGVGIKERIKSKSIVTREVDGYVLPNLKQLFLAIGGLIILMMLLVSIIKKLNK